MAGRSGGAVPRGQLFVAGAAVLYGTVTVGGSFFHRSGFSLYELSLYPLVLTHLMLVPALVRDARYAIRREMVLFFAVYGLIGALAELSQFAGIVLGVPVATVSLLLYLQPIWTGLFGRMLLKERITGRKVGATALAVSGALFLVVAGPLTETSVKGIAFAVLGGVFISLWVIWGRRSGLSHQNPVTTAIGWSGFSAAWLMVLWPLFMAVTDSRAMYRLSFDFAPRYWLFLAAFAFLAGVLPSLLLFRGLQTVSASTAGVILLLEPVSASLLASLLFGEPLGLSTIFGGGLILLSNVLLAEEG